MNPKLIAQALRQLGAANSQQVVGKKNADKDLVYVNPREEAALKASGGSGRIDPITGLRHFDNGDSGEGNSANDSEGGQGTSSSSSGTGGPGGFGDNGQGNGAASIDSNFDAAAAAAAAAALAGPDDPSAGYGKDEGKGINPNVNPMDPNYDPNDPNNWTSSLQFQGWNYDPTAGKVGSAIGALTGVPGASLAGNALGGFGYGSFGISHSYTGPGSTGYGNAAYGPGGEFGGPGGPDNSGDGTPDNEAGDQGAVLFIAPPSAPKSGDNFVKPAGGFTHTNYDKTTPSALLSALRSGARSSGPTYVNTKLDTTPLEGVRRRWE